MATRVYVRKEPKRPTNWVCLSDKQKLAWLEKLSAPNASEKKELKLLRLRVKFAGMAEYVQEKREKEKQDPDYQNKLLEKQRRACRRNREVKSCKECCRYDNCFNGKPLYTSGECVAERRLGLAIILSAIEDYKEYWKSGQKSSLQYVKSWLRTSEQVDVLSMGEYDGVALEESCERRCLEQFGDFETIFNRTQEKLKADLEKAKERYKRAKGDQKRKVMLTIASIERKLVK